MTSAHSHMKRPTGAEPGRAGPVRGRAGRDRSAGVCGGDLIRWRSAVSVPSSMSCEDIRDAWGGF